MQAARLWSRFGTGAGRELPRLSVPFFLPECDIPGIAKKHRRVSFRPLLSSWNVEDNRPIADLVDLQQAAICVFREPA